MINNNVKKSSVNLLDCTLRDGGYYNNWDFDRNVVDQYLKSVSESLIDIVDYNLIRSK